MHETSSCGRLFDAVAGILGFPGTMSFEGQAAAWLEQLQDSGECGAYVCLVNSTKERLLINVPELFAQVWEDARRGVAPGVISRRFHMGLMQGLADIAAEAARARGVNLVALSGGVMQNRTLAVFLPQLLRDRVFLPFMHKEVPSNDGGISLGQASWARAKGF